MVVLIYKQLVFIYVDGSYITYVQRDEIYLIGENYMCFNEF